MSASMHRRSFLGYGLATVAAGAHRPRPVSAHDKIVVGIMGLNNRGTALARSLAKLPDVEIGYLCDVDQRVFAKARQAIGADDKEGDAERADPEHVADYRRILDDKNVDALVVAAPDHWHAPASIQACAAGKDVYVEKPCSHNPREGELLVAAAAKHRRIVQMGNQRRSWPAVIRAIQTAQQKIGRLYFARSWYANSRPMTGPRRPVAGPKWLDWDLWQGPAPRTPFATDIVHYKWHWYWDFGTGEMGNNGVHAIDLCRWALAVDYPTRVTSSGGRYHFADAQQTPDTQCVNFEFAGGKQIAFEALSCNRRGIDGTGFGACIIGTEGSVTIGANEWSHQDRSGKELSREKIAGGDRTHLEDFFATMRTRKAPNSEIVGAHQSTLLSHLGNIAHRAGAALRCDPKDGHILDTGVASKYWGRSYERGWEPVV